MQVQTVQETDWAEAWKEHYHPIPIGRKLMIVPAWLENPQPERIAIRMDPGMAFGTGTHPTTQLCLELIEEVLADTGGGSTVIDVGCGSGILGVAAIKLGASHVLGVDIDRLAVKVSRENAAANGVGERMETGEGSVKEVLGGNFSVRQADIVLANILAPVLVRLFTDGLAGLVKDGGFLVLSGIIEHQAGEVLEAAQAHGLRLVDRRQIADWVALLAG
jgi:ribosomal protein L11 methyltransferase